MPGTLQNALTSAIRGRNGGNWLGGSDPSKESLCLAPVPRPGNIFRYGTTK